MSVHCTPRFLSLRHIWLSPSLDFWHTETSDVPDQIFCKIQCKYLLYDLSNFWTLIGGKTSHVKFVNHGINLSHSQYDLCDAYRCLSKSSKLNQVDKYHYYVTEVNSEFDWLKYAMCAVLNHDINLLHGQFLH